MSIEVKVPVLPESVSDATIATWHKKAGDSVRRDENLLDLETGAWTNLIQAVNAQIKASQPTLPEDLWWQVAGWFPDADTPDQFPYYEVTGKKSYGFNLDGITNTVVVSPAPGVTTEEVQRGDDALGVPDVFLHVDGFCCARVGGVDVPGAQCEPAGPGDAGELAEHEHGGQHLGLA